MTWSKVHLANLAFLSLAAAQVIFEKQHDRVENISRPYQIDDKVWDDAVKSYNATFSGSGMGPGFMTPSDQWIYTINITADIPLESSARDGINKSLVVTGTEIGYQYRDSLREPDYTKWPYNGSVTWKGCVNVAVPFFTKHAIDSWNSDPKSVDASCGMTGECNDALQKWLVKTYKKRSADQCGDGMFVPTTSEDLSACKDWITDVQWISTAMNDRQGLTNGTLLRAASEPYQKGNTTAYDVAARDIWAFISIWNSTELRYKGTVNETNSTWDQSGFSCVRVSKFTQGSRVPGAAASVQVSVLSVLTWVLGSAVMLAML